MNTTAPSKDVIPDSSWWAQYGPIGIVAFLALVALGWVVIRVVLKGWESDKTKVMGDLAAREQAVTELNARVFTILQTNHVETLRLLEEQRQGYDKRGEEQRKEYEERYQALLEDLIVDARTARDQLHGLGSRVTKAFESVGKRIRIEEEEDHGR